MVRLINRVQKNREVMFPRRVHHAGFRRKTDHGHSEAFVWRRRELTVIP